MDGPMDRPTNGQSLLQSCVLQLKSGKVSDLVIFVYVWLWMGVGRPCPSVRNNIVTPRPLLVYTGSRDNIASATANPAPATTEKPRLCFEKAVTASYWRVVDQLDSSKERSWRQQKMSSLGKSDTSVRQQCITSPWRTKPHIK